MEKAGLLTCNLFPKNQQKTAQNRPCPDEMRARTSVSSSPSEHTMSHALLSFAKYYYTRHISIGTAQKIEAHLKNDVKYFYGLIR